MPFPWISQKALAHICPLFGNSACWRMKDHIEERPDVPGKAILDQHTASQPQRIKTAQPIPKRHTQEVYQAQLRSADHPWNIKNSKWLF